VILGGMAGVVVVVGWEWDIGRGIGLCVMGGGGNYVMGEIVGGRGENVRVGVDYCGGRGQDCCAGI